MFVNRVQQETSAVTGHAPRRADHGDLQWFGAVWSGADGKRAIVNLWFDGTTYYAMGANEV